MGLKVWLPLNGDLHNQGNSTAVCNNYGASVNTGGKLGSCYLFDGTDDYLSLTNINLASLPQISLTCWCNLTNDINYFFLIRGSGAHRFRLSGDGLSFRDTNNTGTIRTIAYGATIPTNEWFHLACIYNHGEIYIYINGELIQHSTTYYNVNSTLMNDLNEIRIMRSTSTSGSSYCAGKLNDFRIYDHCLSAAEVREISQGLVLHYKLDGFQGGYGNPNLSLGSQTLSTTATVSNTYISKRGAATLGTRDGFAQVNGTAAWQGFSLWSNSLNLQVGTTYTYSFYAYTALSTSTNAGISFYPMMYNSAGTRDTTSKLPISVMGGTFTEVNAKQIGTLSTIPKLYWATFTWNQTMANILTNSGKIELSIQIHGTFNEGRIDYLWAPKLEIGNTPTNWSPATSEGFLNIIQDSSGYNHNGTILNTVSISSDTPRYSCSTKLEAANSMINCGRGGMVTDSITVNMWIKSSAWANPVSCTESGGWNFEASGDYFRFPVYISEVGYKYGQSSTTKAQICNNSWHMLTGIYDKINQKIQIYVDGQLDNDYATGTSNNIRYHGSNCIWIGAEATGSNITASNGMAGLFSDFRIYCTALNADAIRQLYEIGAKIDNLNNIHTFEFNENGSNKLTKTGILKDYIIEPYKILPDGSKWQLMLYHYVDGGNNLFTQSNATYCNDFGLYSRLRDITNFQYDNKYEYYVIQDDIEYRWTQTSSPLATSVSGLTTVSGYTNPVNGLAKANQSNTYIGYNSWWGACGCWTKYTTGGKTGIPGFGAHSAAGMCVNYLALYVRITDFNAKIANLSAYANNLVEF